MPSKNKPLSRKDNLVVQELDGEVLIYDISENKAFCLNATSALVWEACDGKKSVAEISKCVSRELNSLANEDLVWFALDQLKKENLIENTEDLPNHFAGMSRREVIKKVGLGSMIALPMVASMVAPMAVQAQSACNTAVACTCSVQTGMGNVCPEAAPMVCNGFMSGTPVMTCSCVQSNNGNPNGTCIFV